MAIDALRKSPASVIIPPGGYIGCELAKGQVLRVTDVEGKQVGDLVAFSRDDPREKFWVSNTARLNGTIYLTAGHTLYSERSRPMLKITASTGNPHDMLAGSCNAEIDKVRYGVDNHRGCVENLVKALEPWLIPREDVPMSFNIFMNAPVQLDGTYSYVEPESVAGSYIEFVVQMDLIVAMSNCPEDLNPVNAGKLKPLRWDVSDV